MRIPPPNDYLTRSAEAAESPRSLRYLVLVAMLVVALAGALKSELLSSYQVWLAGLGLLAGLAAATFAYHWPELGAGRQRASTFELFVPMLVGLVALVGLSLLITDWWRIWVISAIFGLGYVAVAHFDHLRLRNQQRPGHPLVLELVLAASLVGAYLVIVSLTLPLLTRLGLIFVISSLTAYRSFKNTGHDIIPNARSVFFAVVVGQVVTLAAWVIFSLDVVGEGIFAVMLLLAWYVNRGLIRHTYEGTLTRNILLEYAFFLALLAYLVLTNVPGR